MFKKKAIIGISLVVILIIVSFCIYKYKDDYNIKDRVENKKTSKDIDEQISNLTLEEKIGQMLIISYENVRYANDDLINILNETKPGGFILFKSNFSSYEDTLKLINDIKETSEIPMFISVDQEGGTVQRLVTLENANVTKIPSMSEVGKLNDKELTHDIGRVIAEELSVFGINMDFAPVIDVKVNGGYITSRSFSDDADVVANLGVSLANGLSENGVIPVYKHFPGHGSTLKDSHVDLPTITKSEEELMNSDLIPYKLAIENGADIIMIGHLSVPNITKGNVPASLSKEVITDLLKKKLGFEGLVITDALNMKAITKNYTEKEIYEMSINAGADLLLMPPSNNAISLIKSSIENGTISEEEIDNSVRKILTLKYEKLKNNKVLDKSYLGSEEHNNVVSKVK